MKAIIQNAELRHIDEVWKKHKPQGLGFSDTDVVVLRLKIEDGGSFSESFYCRIKADGTLGHSISKASEKRQQNLRNFVHRYFSKDKDYDIKKNLSEWKGKKVEIKKIDGGFAITV